MLQYSREVPDSVPDFESALRETVDHVRAHLSACGSLVDSEDEFYADVQVSFLRLDEPPRTRVTGALDVEQPSYPLDALPEVPVDGESLVFDDGEGELR